MISVIFGSYIFHFRLFIAHISAEEIALSGNKTLSDVFQQTENKQQKNKEE